MQLLLEHKVLPREIHERVVWDRASSVGALTLGWCLLFQVEGQPRRVGVRLLQVAVLLRAAWRGHAEGKVSLVDGAVVRHLGRAPAIGKRRHQVGVRLRHLRACVLPHLHRVVREVVLHGGPRKRLHGGSSLDLGDFCPYACFFVNEPDAPGGVSSCETTAASALLRCVRDGCWYDLSQGCESGREDASNLVDVVGVGGVCLVFGAMFRSC